MTAAADALQLDNAAGLSVTNVVFASVTVTGEVPPAGITAPSSAVINTPAWVVTVTASSPVAMQACTGATSGAASCTTAMASNDVLILDPTTGEMLAGFFM
jgi:hypothetical protein